MHGNLEFRTHLEPSKRCCCFQGTAAKSLQSCPTRCDPTDGSPPGSPIPGILQARTLEWVAISFSNAWKCKGKVKSFSRVQLFTTPWTAAYRAPPSMGFSRQGYRSAVPLPSPFREPSTVILLKDGRSQIFFFFFFYFSYDCSNWKQGGGVLVIKHAVHNMHNFGAKTWDRFLHLGEWFQVHSPQLLKGFKWEGLGSTGQDKS